ncbi:MAG: class A beta-lactamase-related serine hydrolase [Chloroflexi bacterium]|nr:class A beta-lactamase-related serine hydrolase [Chloroflexota bacterium]
MLYEKELDTVLKEIIARWGIPGMAVGLVQGDQVVYAEGFGVQSLETQKPVTLDSVFCTASVSKCFTATAVMQLAERGKINLDAPVIQYLPYFELDDERYRQITIRQMLCHTSGMPDLDETEYDEMMEHPERDEGAAERWVRGLKTRKLVANPGEQFYYSNIAYNVLGDMLARVSGKSFETAMQEQILIPSGMLNSTFLLADVQPGLLAVPHLRSPEMIVNPVYPYHRADAPASFLHSTVEDMCHWAITSLNRGRYGRQNILSPAGYDRMWSTVVGRGGSSPGIYEDMGLGWTLGHFKGVRTVSHGGMGFGWTDFLLILPEKNRAAVILCNEESYARSRTVQAVADTLLDIEPQANTVSWMVPISRALQDGGIQAAYICYDEIKRSDEYYFAENDLVNLAIQLTSLKKINLAIEVLGLNIHVFPGHVGSYIEQAKLYLKKGDRSQFEECLSKARAIDPENVEAEELRRAHQQS